MVEHDPMSGIFVNQHLKYPTGTRGIKKAGDDSIPGFYIHQINALRLDHNLFHKYAFIGLYFD